MGLPLLHRRKQLWGTCERNWLKLALGPGCFFSEWQDEKSVLDSNLVVLLLCFTRLCVAALSANNFCDNREALYGVFDGDRNVEVPYLLQCTMSDILAEELQKTKNEEEYMINTFIVMQRWVLDLKRFFTLCMLIGQFVPFQVDWIALHLLQKVGGREERGEKKVVFGNFILFHCWFFGYCLLFLWDVRKKTSSLSHPAKHKGCPTSVLLISVLWLQMCCSQDSGMNFSTI